jgi:hypothetical protein
MCLAIFQPAGAVVPEDYLKEGFRNNPHGAGFMYFDERGELRTYKSMYFDSFIAEYERQWAMHGQESPFAIHFRYATHGTTDITNVHPFVMNKNVAVMHNGIIDCIITDKKMSDTAAFVRDYLGALPRNFQDNEFLFEMVEDYTHGSKLILMTNDPQAQYSAYIFNEGSGHWKDGVWYSNATYSCEKPRGFANFKSAKQSAQVFDDDAIIQILACELCGEESVLDDVCYNCESCQLCWLEAEHCRCSDKHALHSMTQAQYAMYFQED